LSTTTLLANGEIGACCGIGMRLIPELHAGNIAQMGIAEADEIMSNDLLKRWIRVEGPEKILSWAASHDSEIRWEGMYAHRCQACVRLYRDPRVRKVILEHHEEKIADILLGEFLLYEYEYNGESSERTVKESDQVSLRHPPQLFEFDGGSWGNVL
jgi:hypothetical protein